MRTTSRTGPLLPILDVLERLDRVDYVHRDVGTRGELEHYIRRWITEKLDYKLLYLAFHGSTEKDGHTRSGSRVRGTER